MRDERLIVEIHLDRITIGGRPLFGNLEDILYQAGRDVAWESRFDDRGDILLPGEPGTVIGRWHRERA